MQANVLFMGTPAFAVPALEALAARIDREDLLVVTQPDRAAGRGRRLQPPPVKTAAERIGAPVLQLDTLRNPDARARVEAFAPDLIVVAAFGLLLPRWVLNLPARGCVNLHASILPRFRGASPIAAAIASGDAATGVALMQMEPGLDTGAVYKLDTIDIQPDDTTASLTDRLAIVAGGMMAEHLDALLAGSITPIPQRGTIVETRRITKAHGAIDWSQPASVIERHVRAMWPWPRASTICGDVRLQVHHAEVVAGDDAPAGTIVAHDREGIVVATGDASLRLLTVQLAGKAAQPASELRQHPALAVGVRFTTLADPPSPWIVTCGSTLP